MPVFVALVAAALGSGAWAGVHEDPVAVHPAPPPAASPEVLAAPAVPTLPPVHLPDAVHEAPAVVHADSAPAGLPEAPAMPAVPTLPPLHVGAGEAEHAATSLDDRAPYHAPEALVHTPDAAHHEAEVPYHMPLAPAAPVAPAAPIIVPYPADHGAHGIVEAGAAHGGHGHGDAHGEDAHGGEHEHAHHHHEYIPTEAGVAVAYMLVGTVAFVTVVYYAVNWFQHKPRLFAWKMISATLSIFIALATWHSIEQFTKVLYSDRPAITISIAFVLLYVLLQFTLMYLKEKPLLLKAVGTIAGHMCGFAAISCFDTIQERVENMGEMVVALAVFVVLMVAFFFAGARFRRRHKLGDVDNRSELAEVAKQHKEWLEVCMEMEDDALVLAFALLCSQGVRYAILGELPPLRGYPANKTAAQCNQLASVGLILGLFLVLNTWVMKQIYRVEEKADKNLHSALKALPMAEQVDQVFERLHSDTRHFFPKRRIFRLLQATTAMTMTWILIFWSQWYYYLHKHQDKMLMKTILAVLITLAAYPLLIILSLQCVAGTTQERKALQVIVNALGLLVGLVWEKAFGFALEEVVIGDSEDMEDRKGVYMLFLLFDLFITNIVILPAWAFFILPKTSSKLVGGAAELWGDMMEEGSDEPESSAEEEDEETEEAPKVRDAARLQPLE